MLDAAMMMMEDGGRLTIRRVIKFLFATLREFRLFVLFG